MSQWIWKIKQMFRQLMPLALMGAVLYFGYGYVTHGRRGLRLPYSVRSVLSHIPVFGSQFRRGHSSRSYSYGNRGYRSRRGRVSRRGRHLRSRRGRHRR